MIYSTVKIMVINHSKFLKIVPYWSLMLATLSIMTAITLSEMRRIKIRSNSFPENVSASKIIFLILSFEIDSSLQLFSSILFLK